MLLEQIWSTIPGLQDALVQHPLVQDREQVWVMLRQLLLAHAPSTGVTLPGAIFDQVSDVAAAIGLADRLDTGLAGIGNGGLWLGVAKPRADLVVVAHLDRLSFRLRALYDDRNAALSPIYPVELTLPLTQCTAKALRFSAEQGRLQLSARGELLPVKEAESLAFFRADEGTIAWPDTITLGQMPTLRGELVEGCGLDNVAGVLMTLGAAAVLRQVEETMLEHNRRCLFFFHDRHNGLPDALTGRGDSAYVSPALGTVIVGGQVISRASVLKHGAGAAYAFATDCDWHVPLNFQQFTRDLAEEYDQVMPAKAQYNRGGISCQDVGIGRHRGRILGMTGPPLSCLHAGQERGSLKDLQAGIWWLSAFLAAVLNLVPGVTARYALSR